MSLTATQVKYATERLTKIKNRKLEALKPKYTVAAVTFTDEEKLAKLSAGQFTIKDTKAHWWYTAVDFGEKNSYLLDEYKVAVATLEKEYTRIVDELMLGDAEGALAALQAFEALNL